MLNTIIRQYYGIKVASWDEPIPHSQMRWAFALQFPFNNKIFEWEQSVSASVQ